MRGRDSAWFRGAQARHQGSIEAGGVTKDVTFADVTGDADLDAQIHAAYRHKYRHYAATMPLAS